MRRLWISALPTAGIVTVAIVLFSNPGGTPKVAANDSGRAKAGEWSMFGGTPSRNMVNLVEKNPATDWKVPEGSGDDGANIKWVAKLGSRAYGGPTIAGGKIYIGTNNHSPRNPRDTIKRKDGKTQPVDKGVLMCFDEATGKFLWQHVNDKLEIGQVCDWPNEGVCSTPTVVGDHVYYVSNRCEVVCVDANGFANGNQGVQDEKYKDPSDADVIWRYDMMKELNVFPHNMAACCPLVVGDLIFIVTGNGVDEGHINLPSVDAPSFIALNRHTGKLIWRDNSPGKNIMHGQWSNPTYIEVNGQPQVVFPGGDGWLRSFVPHTGELIWRFDANPKDSKYDLGGRGTRSDFIATPVAYNGKIYIGTGQDPEHFEGVGHLWCIDPSKKFDVSPDKVVDGSVFPPKTEPNPNSAAVWHFGGPEANPKQAGRDYVFGRTMSTCAIHDNLLYACDLAGYFHCLDATTGQLHWKHDLKGAVWGSPMWIDGKVYIATDDGDVYIFQHGKQKSEPQKIEIGQPIRGTPIAVNGVLYVKSESNLFAIREKK